MCVCVCKITNQKRLSTSEFFIFYTLISSSPPRRRQTLCDIFIFIYFFSLAVSVICVRIYTRVRLSSRPRLVILKLDTRVPSGIYVLRNGALHYVNTKYHDNNNNVYTVPTSCTALYIYETCVVSRPHANHPFFASGRRA